MFHERQSALGSAIEMKGTGKMGELAGLGRRLKSILRTRGVRDGRTARCTPPRQGGRKGGNDKGEVCNVNFYTTCGKSGIEGKNYPRFVGPHDQEMPH